jgi:hypothetical protein
MMMMMMMMMTMTTTTRTMTTRTDNSNFKTYDVDTFAASVGASTASDEMSWPEILLVVLGIILLIVLILLVLFFCFRQHLAKWCKDANIDNATMLHN